MSGRSWCPRESVEKKHRRWWYCPGTTKQKYYHRVGLVLFLSLFSNYQLQRSLACLSVQEEMKEEKTKEEEETKGEMEEEAVTVSRREETICLVVPGQ